jgi:transposase
MTASEKDTDGWSAAGNFTVILETAGLSATELSAHCRERGLYPEQGGTLVSGRPRCQ